MTARTALTLRAGAALAGGVLLAGVAGASAWAATPYGDDGVDIRVSIPEIAEPGVLAMTVAGDSAALTESGSTSTIRQFTGKLPTVTITDTRSPEDIPDGAAWYVLGSSTDFFGSGGQAPLGADHLGWTPRLIDGGESGGVAEGEPVDTVLDSGPDAVGLVDQELLAIAADSSAIAEEGSWTADADLVLKTEASVAPGDYGSVLTLSLFE
ncbi:MULTISPECIES: hypothetical protein [unclassified Rathayibacter]|uniref:hypothetical protein n=1 Tax=unclassified Rathayibacter TaxID=2609250 RepID=UPI000F4B93A7|nr:MULTISPECIES: hypothetical protein [unclassified Rathayibacter]ROP49166.1 hypothetical protein EDF45_2498 [Rathayibacter sp. PhB186]ROS50717.1 hypothetical protein EDF44_2550 [Rathayibacter sp. PhB185]